MSNILTPGTNLTLRPMKYPQFFKAFEDSQNNNWTIQEISFGTDQVDLREKISKGELQIVKMLVAFFATGDQIVANNAALNLYKHVNSPEARMFYGRQTYEEMLHIQFYLNLLDSYIPDAEERAEMFAAVENVPSVKAKADWAAKWMDQMSAIEVLETDEHRKTFLINLLAFTMGVEGLFFFAAFAYVYYLRDRNLLHGLASGTNWVFRDESSHMNFGFSVVDVIRKELPHLWDADLIERIKEMMREAIECEMMFCEDTLSIGVLGLSRENMRTYLEFVVDGHLDRLGIERMYNVACPFDFMLKQDVQPLTSFFERTVSEYSVGIGGKVSFEVEDF